MVIHSSAHGSAHFAIQSSIFAARCKPEQNLRSGAARHEGARRRLGELMLPRVFGRYASAAIGKLATDRIFGGCSG
jgi:hypothetical protein